MPGQERTAPTDQLHCWCKLGTN